MRNGFRFLVSVALVAGMAGCGSVSDSALPRVRTFNTLIPASGADGMLVIKNGSEFLTSTSGLPFGQFAFDGGFAIMPSGVFNPSGTGTGLPNALTFATPPTLTNDNAAFTLVAAGQSGQTNALAPTFLLVPNFTPAELTLPAGSAAIRVVNVSANPNPLGLFKTTNGVPTTALATSLSSVSFGFAATSNGYVAIPVAQLTNLALVETTQTGTALILSSASNLNTFAFEAGRAYTLYIFGQSDSSAQPLSATWVLDFPS